ncbi:MAG TPA: M55 family metallopeptidase [Candidatus Cloacimonadota bacterium]|nr:M55 family metallopeptidase [Candidatus Cloacimonadota bacterium]
MKLYISLDMEGIPGTFNWENEKLDRPMVRKAIRGHIEDLIEGIRESRHSDDISEIVIADSHSAGDNLDYDITGLDERIYLISGSPRPYYMMPMLDSSFGQVFLLGYHAGTGALKGNMDHTYSNSRIQKIFLNDQPMNEALINAAYAGFLGVPVSLVTGDLTLRSELLREGAMPWLKYVVTKEAHSKFSAKNYPQNVVRQSLHHEINSALAQNRDDIPLYALSSPYRLKIEFHSTAMADQACMMPYTKRLDGRTILYEDNDFGIIFEAIMALVTLASTVGI